MDQAPELPPRPQKSAINFSIEKFKKDKWDLILDLKNYDESQQCVELSDGNKKQCQQLNFNNNNHNNNNNNVNMQQNILYSTDAAQPSGSKVSVLNRPNLLFKSKTLSSSTDELTRRAKHHLIDLNASNIDNNGNSPQMVDQMVDEQKEKIMHILKINSSGRSNSLTSPTLLPMVNNPLYNNFQSTSNMVSHVNPLYQNSSFIRQTHFNPLSPVQGNFNIPFSTMYPGSSTGVPSSTPSTTSPLVFPSNGHNYFQQANVYANLNFNYQNTYSNVNTAEARRNSNTSNLSMNNDNTVVNSIISKNKTNIESTASVSKATNTSKASSQLTFPSELLTPTSVFVPQDLSKDIINMFDPLVKRDCSPRNAPSAAPDNEDHYTNIKESEDSPDFSQKNESPQVEDSKNNNAESSSSVTLRRNSSLELETLFKTFHVKSRTNYFNKELYDYCEHLKALYLSFFYKPNTLINSGLLFSSRIEIDKNRQNQDYSKMEQLYLSASSNSDTGVDANRTLKHIDYVSIQTNNSSDEDNEANSMVIFDIQMHSLVYRKLTGIDSDSKYPFASSGQTKLAAESVVKPLDDNNHWFSLKFSASIEKTVEMIVSHVVYNVVDTTSSIQEENSNSTQNINIDDFLLKVSGCNEFLLPKTILSSYVYVQKCKKNNKDIVLELIDQTAPEFWRPFLRSDSDTVCIQNECMPNRILPQSVVDKFHGYTDGQLNGLIEELNTAYTTLVSSLADIEYFKQRKSLFTNVMDCIQQLCLFLSRIETSALTDSIESFRTCYSRHIEFIETDSEKWSLDCVTTEFNNVFLAIVKEFINIIDMYSETFPVRFELNRDQNITDLDDDKKDSNQNTRKRSKNVRKIEITSKTDIFNITIDVCAQIPDEWHSFFSSYSLFVTIFHGFNIIGFSCTDRVPLDYFKRVVFKEKLLFNTINSAILPRETRIEFVLVGFRSFNTGKQEVDAVASTFFYLYDQDQMFRKGNHLLPFTMMKQFFTFQFNPLDYGPDKNAPPVIFENSFLVNHNYDPSTMMLVFTVLDANDPVEYYFPEIKTSTNEEPINLDTNVPIMPSYETIEADSLYGFYGHNTDFLDQSNRSSIIKIIQRNPLEPINQSERELIWENRETLTNYPGAIVKILKSPPTWSYMDLRIVYQVLKQFDYSTNSEFIYSKPPFNKPIEALQLLGSDYPDQFVRRLAVRWLKTISIDELCDYLPQFVQALRYETSIDSCLIWLLFEFSLISARFCHFFYWNLNSCLADPVFGHRCEIYINSLLILCGKRVSELFIKQNQLCTQLASVCDDIKRCKDRRPALLCQRLEKVNQFLESNPISVPLSPSMHVNGLKVSKCSYFNSNSLPLKIIFQESPPYLFKLPSDLSAVQNFANSNTAKLTNIYDKKVGLHKIIFKCGDDLRQDMLVMQIISIINRIWLRANLDLRLIIFGVLNNSDRTGMIEMVSNACTLREIQQVYGVTGTFKQHTIAAWLKRQNPSEFDYMMAVENFIHSCAGYVVITYLLGICDRHNDNIMVTTSGNLFHIDFGKFLGDAQMMAGFRRDRVPFVFTADMAYVINLGDIPSKNYQFFVELCCNCFTLVRQNGNFLLSLLASMIPSGIFGLTPETIKYFHNALMPDLTDSQAKVQFNKLIEKALNSFSTQMNFFIHSLAQLRHSSGNVNNNNNSDTSSHSAHGNFHGVDNAALSRLDYTTGQTMTTSPGDGISPDPDMLSLEHPDLCTFSFTSRRFTENDDGYITSLEIVLFFKQVEENEKVYYYKIKVDRRHLPESFVFRSYKEFVELYEKMSKVFPLVHFPRLSRSPMLTMANRRELAEQRSSDIQNFLNSFKRLAPEISHSDIVYTFFHPIYRDQKLLDLESDTTRTVRRERRSQIKLNICYNDGTLNVMVCHVKNLKTERNSPPDTYVKLYLKPDPNKLSKRKTRVVYRNAHPTFMESLVYHILLDELRLKTLEVSVWSYDMVSGNSCLGRIEVPFIDFRINKKIEEWFILE